MQIQAQIFIEGKYKRNSKQCGNNYLGRLLWHEADS